MKSKEEGKKKRTYEKPELMKVHLAPDEVLASGCKMSGAGSAFGASPCVANNCSGAGS